MTKRKRHHKARWKINKEEKVMKILFWNVDTQKDFMNKDGKLYVEGAESIKQNLQTLTALAYKYNIKIVNTGDCHTLDDEEISKNPNFKTTFPPHCLITDSGSDFIGETYPFTFKGNYYICNRYDIKILHSQFDRARNIIIYKNKFDVFTGNKLTSKILNKLDPDLVVVYGVATNVCVNFAVLGLQKRKKKVIVVLDAIKELPNLSVNAIYKNWLSIPNIVLMNTKDLIDYLCKPKIIVNKGNNNE